MYENEIRTFDNFDNILGAGPKPKDRHRNLYKLLVQRNYVNFHESFVGVQWSMHPSAGLFCKFNPLFLQHKIQAVQTLKISYLKITKCLEWTSSDRSNLWLIGSLHLFYWSKQTNKQKKTKKRKTVLKKLTFSVTNFCNGALSQHCLRFQIY